MGIKKFILQTIAPFKLQLTFFVFGSVVWAIELPLRPYFIKCAIDSVTLGNISQNKEKFFLYIFLYFLLILSKFIINTAYEYIWLKFFPQLKANIGVQVFKDLIDLPYAFYQNHFAGSLGNRLNNCVNSIPRIIRILNEEFFRYLLAILISSYTLWYIDFKCSLALTIWVSIYISISIIMAPLVKKRSIEVAKEASRGMGYVVDVLSNIVNTKLFNNEKIEVKEVIRNFNKWKNLAQARDFILVNLYTFQALAFIIFQAACIYWLLKISDQESVINVGDFVLVFSISFSIYSSLHGLARTIADYSENLGTVSEALSLIYSFKGIKDKPTAVDLKVSNGRIVFDAVEFHYRDKSTEPLFQNKSVTIKAGQKVGLVGFSGSGKTTFINLILRLYDVTGGYIFIDDQNIRDVTQDSLHRAIAMIPQDPFLFHRTLMDNIRYGRIDATNEDVIKAAKKAHAHEFIIKLPQRYESLVGERGVKLSGGQRQRIAIARAILKNAPILILDEATSQLDSITESNIQKSLWELMQNKTTIVVAHRLSTLLHMDRILVFDKGKIVEDGIHTELLNKGGLYKTLWDAQVGGLLPDKRDKDEL
jgi:ATP-binding cassette subfamily B protein